MFVIGKNIYIKDLKCFKNFNEFWMIYLGEKLGGGVH